MLLIADVCRAAYLGVCQRTRRRSVFRYLETTTVRRITGQKSAVSASQMAFAPRKSLFGFLKVAMRKEPSTF